MLAWMNVGVDEIDKIATYKLGLLFDKILPSVAVNLRLQAVDIRQLLNVISFAILI